jgi:cyclic dehypoxanthinyl futalosine synthase
VHRVWHKLGGRSTATMMFGHIETLDERVEHLERVRQLQNETGGLTAFISWTFQPDHTDMADVPATGAFEYLRTQALSRIYLDNVPNIRHRGSHRGPRLARLLSTSAPMTWAA